MLLNSKYNPYRQPSPYEVLGLNTTLECGARDITKAHKKLHNEARTIADPVERERRIQALKEALDQLLRPESRVLFDFFLLGKKLFAELCVQFADKLASAAEPLTPAVLGSLSTGRSYDNLLPENLDGLTTEFQLNEQPDFFDEPGEMERLPLLDVDL